MILAASLTPFPAHGQTETPDSSSTIVRVGNLFDSDAGRLVGPMDLRVRNGRILEVARRLAIPPGSRLVDISGYTVLPGLIDSHTHLLTTVRPYASITPLVPQEGMAPRALRAACYAQSYLESGFTGLRDLGNSGQFGDVALRDGVRNGDMPGPRIFVSGPGLATEGGQIESADTSMLRAAASEEYRIIRSPEEGRLAVREAIARRVDLIKVYADQRPRTKALSMEELRAIVSEAHRAGVPVTAHATSDVSAWRAITAGVDAIEHGYELADSTLRALRLRRIAVVLTVTDIDSAAVGPLARRHASPDLSLPAPDAMAPILAKYHAHIRRVFASGVDVVAGSDAYWEIGIPRGQFAKRVLFVYAQAGVPLVPILQSVTIVASRLLRQPMLGSLKPGNAADLIAVEGDPTTDLSALERVRFIMLAGKPVVLPPSTRAFPAGSGCLQGSKEAP